MEKLHKLYNTFIYPVEDLNLLARLWWAEAEHKLIARIPLVRGLRPRVVEPQTIGITVEVENVRVTVTVSNLLHSN